jgi:hypothetical protein
MRVRSALSAVLFSVSLAACGGGGSSGGGPVSVSPPVVTPVPPNLSQTATQRTDAESGLVGIEAYRSFATGGSPSTLGAVRQALAHADMRTFVTHARRFVTCSDGTEESEVASGSTVTVTIATYYDANCTQIENQLVWTASQQGSDITGPATFTEYSTAGVVTSTSNATVTFVYTNSSLTTLTGISFLITASTGQVGLACSVTATGSTTACGVALTGDASALSEELGAETTVTASGSQLTMQLSVYQGALNALTISQGTFPSWTISPASDATASVALSGGVTATGFSLSMTDSTDGASLSMTGNAAGAVTGTLTNTSTGASVATFAVDANGNGTLTYSNGSTAAISDYIIQS